MIFSTTCSTTLFTCSTTPRVSASPSTSRPACLLKSGCGGASRRSRSSFLVLCASKLSEAIDGKKSSTSSTVAAAPVFASSSAYDQDEISAPRTFLDARTEQGHFRFCSRLLVMQQALHALCLQKLLFVTSIFMAKKNLLLGIQKEAEAGRLPINVAQGMEELYHNYRNAVFHSGHPKAHEIVFSNMAVALDRIFMDVRDPFQFSPHHKAIREPFDYYIFGQKYISPLLDFRNSFLGNISLFNEMEKKLQQICVAGDRVVTDPLCKPFSMGRNLLCVYSKKHMNDDPELIDMKRRANTKSLKEMAMLLRAGSKIIWIAPSGGRDRPDPVTKEWYPAPFDASSVDNMRRLVEHAGVPGHIYPLAILCYDVMPPPAQVEKEIGEKRVISFHGVGLSVAPEISYQEITATLEDPEEAKNAFSELLYSSVCEQYNVLTSAIHGKQGLAASTRTVSLSQPWE
ncbi:UNVERIFIED_CONTAM: Glycerol-3-phosphate acyltransferase ATS12, chloroplastic [Sesamum radiatum]|uniref:Glycerol-3-phosphate acyltransferase, chloroplastic n=1 Tax=Sesamum radiatum TaxID=300843 RepID=A0AAW2ME53_SESRA